MSPDRPSRRYRTATRLALSATLVVALLAVVAVGPVAPDSADGNYTVEPEDQPKDRRPNETGATWNHLLTTNVSLDLETVEFRSNAGSFEDCTASTVGTFGVDRGNDSNGTTIDESFRNRTDRIVNGPNRLQIEFQSENNSSLPSLNAGDQLVVVPVECFENAEDPGWYKFRVWLNGTEANGTTAVDREFSDWVGVCNCEGDEDAQQALGPPVGTPATPTPMPTSTPTEPSGSTTTDSPTPSGTGQSTTTPKGTATARPTRTPTDGTSTVSPTDLTSPTEESGSGFGSLLTITVLALLTVALVRSRRDN